MQAKNTFEAEKSGSRTDIQTPTFDNHDDLQAIQRPVKASGYLGQFSRIEQVIVTKDSPRINPDSMKTLWVTVGLIMVLGLTSFLVSFNGLMDVAAWVGLPVSLRWTVPAFIDVSILAYSMAAVIHKARNERVVATWLSLGVFTLISVVANAVHAVSQGEGSSAAQVMIGATIAAAAPIAVFAATEELSRLAFRSPVREASQVPAVEGLAAVEEATTEREVLAGQSARQVLESALSTEPVTVADSIEELETPEKSVQDREDSPVEDDLAVIARWVEGQQAQGQKVTGASVGRLIGKSSRTGSSRLAQLKETMPELFEKEEQG